MSEKIIEFLTFIFNAKNYDIIIIIIIKQKDRAMLIDSHCHFFTKNMLDDRLQKLGFSKNAKWLSYKLSGHFADDTIAGAAEFFDIGINKSPMEMYEYLRDSYGCDFIAVPLMLDTTFAFLSPDHEDKQQVGAASKRGIPEKFMESVEKRHDIIRRSTFGTEIFKDSYQHQIDDLTYIKSQIPERVYPFFSIDPRRNHEFENGILGQIKKYVGKDKPFLGLKLYSSLGYSPTDPVLYDNSDQESVYEYCEKNNIPITTHSSIEGFSHFLDKTSISGDVYYPYAGKCINAKELYEDGVVPYKNKVKSLSFEHITSERLVILNHPMLWRKVLEKYPKLRLNMAHLGGVIQATQYALGKKTSFWTEYVLKLVAEFKNVYTDLSCYYEHIHNVNCIEEIYKQIYKKASKKVQDKILYGSDYYMLALYNTDPKDYIDNFRKAFGKDFYRISEVNPKKFLRLK